MSDEIDREEITTRKITPLPYNSVNGSRISEERTTKATNDNGANGLVLGALLTLAVAGGAIAYFMNNRPVTTQIVTPRPTDTIRENKSTVIERNNTTTVQTATPQPTATTKVEINVPSSAPQPTPRVEINLPTVTAQPQPAVTAAPTPAATTQPQTPVATPSPRP
jgi:hypothetical protein